uniref:MICOS complex subunit n=1 Tax=Dracunculus medinensis TaxID=318479 RepID=A0A158Q6M0_DRAME
MQLPVYSEDYPRTYKFIEDQPLFLQNQISAIRKIVTQEYDARFEGVDKTAKKAMKTMPLNKAFQEEWSIIPKAAAITIGGLAVLYTGVGLLSMAAFCYPNETVAIVRTGVTHSRIYWQNFKDERCNTIVTTTISESKLYFLNFNVT